MVDASEGGHSPTSSQVPHPVVRESTCHDPGPKAPEMSSSWSTWLLQLEASRPPFLPAESSQIKLFA